MATRTIKLMGKAYSNSGDVSLVVNFNNTEVFNGTVATVNAESPAKGDSDIVELASWNIDTSITGNIPLSISVTGGVFHFTDLNGNYSGFVLQETDGVRDRVDGEFVVITQPVDFFGVLNTNSADSDGKNNVTFSEVDGDGQQRNPQNAAEEEGEWVYIVDDGNTFSCDFVIDPNLVITTAPTPTD